jgi:hypothetical protein
MAKQLSVNKRVEVIIIGSYHHGALRAVKYLKAT